MNNTGNGQSSSREVGAWVLYDWANSAFATTVMAGFFPLYFKMYLSEGAPVHLSTARLGLANAAGTLLIALAAPLLGAGSDLGGFMIGAVFYAIAGLGFAGAVTFYDALLPSVARGRNVDRISASGYAWGYLGGGLLFAINLVMFLKPAWFGLSGPEAPAPPLPRA